jgi:hypothetical protein
MGRQANHTMLRNLLQWLEDAAAQGKRCPTNDEIAERYGFSSTSSSAHLVRMLEKHGYITVERPSRSSRTIVIVATGARLEGRHLEWHKPTTDSRKQHLLIDTPIGRCAESARLWKQLKPWPENARFDDAAVAPARGPEVRARIETQVLRDGVLA